MKQKVFLTLIIVISGLVLSAQNDPTNQVYKIPDSILDRTQQVNFEDILSDSTESMYELQTQKLMKNLFLGGFIFMTLVVIFMVYINKTKIKEIVKLIKEQEQKLMIKEFETKKFSTIINNTIDAIIITSKSGDILWNNNSFMELYNYKSDEIENKKIDLLKNIDDETYKRFEEDLKQNKAIQYTFEDKNKDRNTIYIHRRIIPMIDNGSDEVNYAIIDTDFTALKLYTDLK